LRYAPPGFFPLVFASLKGTKGATLNAMFASRFSCRAVRPALIYPADTYPQGLTTLLLQPSSIGKANIHNCDILAQRTGSLE